MSNPKTFICEADLRPLDDLFEEMNARIKEVGLKQAAQEFAERAEADLDRLSAELKAFRESREGICFFRIAERIRRRTKNPETLARFLLEG